MVICKHCDKPNTLDGLFCRACGHALDEQDLQSAKTANQALLADGFKLLSEQRYAEALMVADKVLETDPSVAQGYSLRGDGLERTGDLVGALSAYERVNDLQPDSTLDRIKLTHLRNVIAERTQVAPAPNKRTARLAGVAAFILVGSLGSAFALWVNSRETQTALVQGTAELHASALNPSQNPVAPVDTDIRKPAPAQTNPQPRPTVEPAPETPPARTSNGQLPEARPNGMSGEVQPLRPGNIQITPIPDAAPTPAPARPPMNDPEPNAQSPSQAAPSQTTPTQPAPAQENKPKPVIDIRPSPNGSRPIGNSQTVPESGPRTANDWIRAARNAFIQQNYSEAEQAYAKALSLGADAGLYNQRRAQCLEQLGRKAEAIQAYEAAIAAYERRVRAGTASESDRSGLEASKRAANALR